MKNQYSFFTLFFFCNLFFCTTKLIAQHLSNKTVFWRGFEHSWTYNHRINRIGNYIKTDTSGISAYHVSASGLGADSTTYTSHYSFVSSPDVQFYTGVANIKLYGKEKHLLSKTIEVIVPAPKGIQNKEQYITLLNGFDLKAVERADKIQLLRLSIEDAEYAPAIQEIRFLLKVALVVNCQSMECSRFNQKTTYDLKVYYQIVAGANKDYQATSKIITKHYPWGRKDEHFHIPEKSYVLGKKNGGYVSAALGIKSLALTLDAAHWTVQYNNNITPLLYDSLSGRLDFSTDLFFKEWQQGMKKLSAKPEHSAFSSKKKGWCVLDMGITLFQFKNAEVVHKKHSKTFYWKGFNSSADSPKASSKVKLSLPKQN